MKNRFLKAVCIFLIITLLSEAIFPTISYALTSGPSQPEVQSFEPIGTSEMVDLFSGDFQYNIPLLDVEGYPVNISYQSGMGMDHESSWCGMGWNVNPGAINRNMRGMPDDFDGTKGDYVEKEFNIKPNRTYGVSTTIAPEAFGIEGKKGKPKVRKGKKGGKGILAKGTLTFGLGISYNNYKGFGFEQSLSPSIKVAEAGKGSNVSGLGVGATLNSSSQSGLTISPSVSFEENIHSKKADDVTSISSSFNSRYGLKSLNLSASPRGEAKLFNANIDLGMITYIPEVNMPMVNTSVMFAPKFGGAFFGFDGMFTLSGYYSEQSLDSKTRKQRAYGYFNTEKGNNDPEALLDFNREKDATFTKNTKRLPVTNFTYDLYSVNGQGIGGMFKPNRSEVGYVFDGSMTSRDNSYSLGLDFAAGNLVKGGADVAYTKVVTSSGKWVEHNPVAHYYKYSHKKEGSLFEPFYFKEAGEKSVDDDLDYYSNVGEEKPVTIGLVKKSGLVTGSISKFIGQTTNLPTRKTRKKRNQAIAFLTNEEAQIAALEKQSTFTREEDNFKYYLGKPSHHIGEISAIRPDGARYVYGIPAYNKYQKEVTFSVGQGIEKGIIRDNDGDGLIFYNPGNDNSIGNEHGLDNYYNSTIIRDYAHSYLLTAVLSADYIDNDGTVGPSRGDMGTYTKFNYKKANDFKWRVPVGKGENQANVNEGLKSIDKDDQANYLYGEKELYYLASIETKSYIAIFETGPRADGFGVKGENGGLRTYDDKNNFYGLQLLKSIKLYAKDKDGKEGKLIKSIDFIYDYSLCSPKKGNGFLENNILAVKDKAGLIMDANGFYSEKDENGFTNQGGKLTLKRIYFTHGSSNRGRFSPYEFTYCNGKMGLEHANPSYNLKAVDRWGTYKPYWDPYKPNVGNDFRRNSEFPYVSQDKVPIKNSDYNGSKDPDKYWADIYASAWQLTDIKLPSGGSIKVKYESDDYGYVQDKQVMQMYKVIGLSDKAIDLSKDPSSQLSNKLYEGTTPYNHVYFKIPDHIDLSTYYKIEDFVGDIDQMYFRFLINLDKPDMGNFEYVPGYSQIESKGLDVSTRIGYVVLKGVAIDDRAGDNTNPIAKAAMQFSRLYTPGYAFGETDVNSNLGDVFKGILRTNFVSSIKNTIKGVNRYIRGKEMCKQAMLYNVGDPTKPCSYIRLLEPTKMKKGGGSRVASVLFNDHAADMGISGGDFEYGQEYDYKTEDAITGNLISSGVAAYEPLVGGDENPLRQPIYNGTKQERLLVPDDRFYIEGPMGESFFPGASVGYSKVSVKNISHENVKRHATGKVVHEFYTAKDYPIFVDQTPIEFINNKSPLVMRLLKISNKDFMTTSQGYSIELNDMHGKQKAQWVYAEGKNSPISGIEYKYKSDGNRLVNKALAVNKHGETIEAQIGVDVDIVMDMRQHQTTTQHFGLHFNMEAFLAVIFPGFVPLVLPAYSKEHVRFRSAVTTKVINRYGLLDEVIAHDLGSRQSTSNLAYDAETGEVLVTKLENEFKDPVFNVTYPSHWIYEGMGQAYKNIHFTSEVSFDQDGTASVSGASSVFVEGDEVLLLGGTNISQEQKEYKYWITKVEGDNIKVMGGKLNNNATTPAGGDNVILKVIRSGRRNLQSLPVGSVTMLNHPLENDDKTRRNLRESFTKALILNSTAQEYKDDWKVFCQENLEKGNFNPYFAGAKGNWRLFKSYTYLSNRKYEKTPASRNGGAFLSYDPFWQLQVDGTKQWNNTGTTNADWRWVNEVTAYDPYGSVEVENKNPLDIHSSAIFGYDYTQVKSVVANSKKKDTFVDSFEDYEMNSPADGSFIKFAPATLDYKTVHSGRRSIKVATGGKVTIDFNPPCETP